MLIVSLLFERLPVQKDTLWPLIVVKLYTLNTQNLEIHTLFCSTYPYRPNKVVPPWGLFSVFVLNVSFNLIIISDIGLWIIWMDVFTSLIHNLNFLSLAIQWLGFIALRLLLLFLFLLFIYIFYVTFDHLPVLWCCSVKFVCPNWFGSCFFYVLLYFSSCRKWEVLNCIYGQPDN